MIVRIIAVGLIALFVIITLRQVNPTAAAVAATAAGVLIIGLVIPQFRSIIESLGSISQKSGISQEYIKLLLKVVGIGYITEFAASAARDAGEKAVGDKLDLAGKISITVISMPLFLNLIELITGFI